MLKLIENLSEKTAAQLLSVLPETPETAFVLFALLDWVETDGAWVQSVEGTLTALVVKTQQTHIYVAAGEQADFAELRLFLQQLGGAVVHCATGLSKALGVTAFSKQSLLLLNRVPPAGKKAITVTDGLRPIFDLQTQSARAAVGDAPATYKYYEAAYKNWLSKTARGIFNGYTVVKAVYVGKNALLSAAVADILQNWVYIRDVVTDADYRRMGYGSDCICSLCAELKTADNRVFLLCNDLKTEKFYKKCGFENAGSIEQGIVEL